jgi:hypothetical protein
MIGATDNADALKEAGRSLDSRYTPELSRLECWDGARYVPVLP